MFSSTDLNDMQHAAMIRKNVLIRNIAQRCAPKILEDIKNVLDKDVIKQLMKEKCNTFLHPADLKLSIYGYDKRRIVNNGDLVVRMHDVMEKTDLLFLLVDEFGYKNFRLTTQMVDTMEGWREIILHYYPNGTPQWLRQVDPTMPPLIRASLAVPPPAMRSETVIPPSPVPVMNPEDDYDDYCCSHSYCAYNN